jgi:tetratricopeptide (TPR) repeat protein
MRNFVLLLFGISLSVNCVMAEEIDSLIAQGDSLMAIYEYQAAGDKFGQAVALDSTSVEANWKLANSLNLFAELQPKDQQLELYEKASQAAERTIALDSLQPEGHFQLARALGKIALFKGVFKSIGLAKRVKKEAEITLELDPDNDGAYHILGRWHREVAQKPKFLRVPMGLGEADKKKGLPLLARAVEIRPEFIHHRLEYGISLLHLKYKEEAKEQFELCLTLPAEGPLDIKYQKEAKDYLAKLNKNN